MSPPDTQRGARHRPPTNSIVSTLDTSGSEGSAQLDLFVSPGVRLGDPDTSRAAATMATGYRGWLRDRVLDLLRQHDANDSELCEQLPHEHPGSVSKRRCDLVRAGLVVDSGERRPTRTGCDAVVWVAIAGNETAS